MNNFFKADHYRAQSIFNKKKILNEERVQIYSHIEDAAIQGSFVCFYPFEVYPQNVEFFKKKGFKINIVLNVHTGTRNAIINW